MANKMDCFSYKNGIFHAENVSIEKLVSTVDTPFYCYSSRKLQENFAEFDNAFRGLPHIICYAIKANANQAIVRTLADCGAGADIVSVGELVRALHAEIPPEKIVFSGAGKTHEEITAALIAHIRQINVESIPELRLISNVAAARGLSAPVALRINPDIKAGGHDKISTGHKETKFGIGMDQLGEAMSLVGTLPGLVFKGFSVHIGSHINDYEPLRASYVRLAEIAAEWKSKGFDGKDIDLGGGVPIAYDGETESVPFSAYAGMVHETVGKLGFHVSFEPGRRLVGTAGILVSRVLYVKDTPEKRFVIIDAAMNDLVRPAMYEARHSIVPVKQSLEAGIKPASVVGPICESSDSFGDSFALPDDIREGDFIAILQAGAYGSSMASTYNARSLIPEVMVNDARSELIRRRISVAEQMSWESMPSWI